MWKGEDIRIRFMVGFLVANWPAVDMIARVFGAEGVS